MRDPRAAGPPLVPGPPRRRWLAAWGVLWLVAGLQGATQWFAYAVGYSTALGPHGCERRERSARGRGPNEDRER
jgi:hypothetical protein